jgi:uncharacterized protein YecE (DUF72 family)
LAAEMITIGCAGFPTSMVKYFESFNLVELNTTFYQYPKDKTVEDWRKKAPKDFEFTVKAHQDISHKTKLKVEEASVQAFERMKQICKTLNSKILLIKLRVLSDQTSLEMLKNFLEKLNVKILF